MNGKVADYRRHGDFNWDKAVLAPILAKADIRPHERVLDLGCGSGETTFAWILPSAGRVLAVDADPEMVAAAQNLLQAQPESLRSKCTFEVRDGQALGDFKQKFDVCFTNAALHWMKKDPPAVAQGVLQALKPGGRFVGEFGGHLNVGLRSSLHRAFKSRGLPVLDPWWFPTPEEYREVLESTGFRVDWMELVPRPTPLKNGVRAWLETFSQSFLAAARSPEEREEILAELENELAVDMQDSKGNWTCMYVRLRFVAFKP